MTAAAPLERAYGFAEAAERLTELGYRVSERWLRVHSAEVPHVTVGRAVRFTDSLLAEFVASKTVRPAPRTAPAGGRRRRAS